MKIDYKRLSLRPYPGEILLFGRLDWMRGKYTALTGEHYPYRDEPKGGRFIKIDNPDSSKIVYLVYGKAPHVLAHEFSHIILHTFEMCGIDPIASKGEPFCYMLSQLMLDAR